MQEAMDMTPEEFDAAAHQLLEQERIGGIRLPALPIPNLPSGPPDPRWGEEEDERTPLNPLPGAPSRFTAAGRQADDAAAPQRPTRRREGPPRGRGGPDDMK